MYFLGTSNPQIMTAKNFATSHGHLWFDHTWCPCKCVIIARFLDFIPNSFLTGYMHRSPPDPKEGSRVCILFWVRNSLGRQLFGGCIEIISFSAVCTAQWFCKWPLARTDSAFRYSSMWVCPLQIIEEFWNLWEHSPSPHKVTATCHWLNRNRISSDSWVWIVLKTDDMELKTCTINFHEPL